MNEPQPTTVVLDPQGKPTNPEVTETKTAPTPEKPQPEPAVETKPDAKPSALNEKDPAKPEGAPEKYEAFKLPDGVKLDDVSIKEATAVFKDLGLSQDAAQKLVDFHVKTLQAAQDSSMQVWKEQQEAWQNELKSDPAIGGKLPQVKTAVSKAIDAVVGQELGNEFRKVMDVTGAGNNAVFAKVLYAFAQRVTEGTHVSGNAPSPEGQRQPGAAPPTAAKALYPNLT